MSELSRNVCDYWDMSAVPQVSVFGEALIDLIVPEEGEVHAVAGGAPFNTARALGRLGVTTSFIGSVAQDRFGDRLVAQLIADEVDVAHVRRTSSPTTLALAELSANGTAAYRFYVDGTSASESFEDLPYQDGGWLMTGGLGLVLNPLADRIVTCIAERPATARAMIDINCRPLVITRPDEYRERLANVLPLVDVVKVSDEDLAYLYPKVSTGDAARKVLESGPSLVLLTAGSDPVQALTASGSSMVEVPAVDVVDTVGAGDTFGAGFLAWWVHHGNNQDVDIASLTDLDLVTRAVTAGVHASTLTVGRRGADPPYRSELDDDLWR